MHPVHRAGIKNVAELGQSTVEFILTMTLFIGFMFFFLQISLIFSFGNYVHYATFMAARAYLSAGADPSDQQDRAKRVMGAMLKRSSTQVRGDKFPMIAKGVGGTDSSFPGLDLGEGDHYVYGDPSWDWMIGVRYTFSGKLFPIAIGKSNGPDPNAVTLTSESWLGREPTSEECRSSMSQSKGYWDNGC